MIRSGLVDTLVTHANMKGLGLTPLFGEHRDFMPPQLKTRLKLQKLCEESAILEPYLQLLQKYNKHFLKE